MSRRLVERVIRSAEICVRCLLHPMHVATNSRLQDASLIPAKGKNDVSLLREQYTNEAELTAHGHHLVQTISTPDHPQQFEGLLYLTQNTVDSVNQWAGSEVAKLEGVGGSKRLAEIVYAPMKNDVEYVDTNIDVFTEDPNIALPHHADLKYRTEVCHTLRRHYGHELMRRVKYRLVKDDGSLDCIKQEAGFQNYSSVPKLSIIVTYFKDAKYISKCIDSIVREIEGKPVEVIWISDDSPDDSKVKVGECVARHANQMDMFGIQHQGQGMARNCGMELARGEYVWFVDADDELEQDAVSTILSAIESGSQAYVFRTVEHDDVTGKEGSKRRYMKATKGHPTAGMSLLLRRCSFSPSLMVVFNKQYLLSRGLKFGKYKYLDLDFMPRFLMHSETVEIIPKVIYRYYEYPPKKGQPRLSDDIMKELLKLFCNYCEMAEHSDDKQEKEALYYVAHMVLIYIFAEPKKTTFMKYVEKGILVGSVEMIKRVVRQSRYVGNGPKEWCFWKLAGFNPFLAKKIFG